MVCVVEMSLPLNQIVCGDCLEVMKKIKNHTVDALVTDPPFTFSGGNSAGRSSEISEQFYLHWWKDVCKQFQRVLKKDAEGFIWCDWRCASVIGKGFQFGQIYGLRLAQMLFHYREMSGQGSPFRSSVDLIAYIRGPKSKGHRIPNTTHNLISKYWYYGKHKHHPAEKDVEIAPFIGSGTVGIACLETKRQFIGIDMNEDYCKIAKERVHNHQCQTKLLETKE